ncbi:MAG: tetratricopeptide repeat protein [Treponema sp.]|jgi:tetratricopeptide (TPR) repeat protein|nr:tetratricopeptide repeat protein [Treponema sp.]
MKSSRIVFLPVPGSLEEEIRTFSLGHGRRGGTFTIDPAIPLPVELEEEESLAELAERLSWEMILSGMIRVVASPVPELKPHWIGYYRSFVLAVKPEIYDEFTGAAIVKAKNGDFDMALEIILALEGLFPMAPGPALNKALILEDMSADLEKKGRAGKAEKLYVRAAEAYQRVLSLEPVLPDALFNAGFFFMRRRDYGKAREYFSAYLPLADDPEKQEKARSLVKEIRNRALDDDGFLEALDFIRQGEEQKALESIRPFLEEHPTVWNGWFVLGWALRKLGRWQDGLESFKKALELGGGNSDTKNEMAICLMELGDLSGAGKELEAALREEPENIKIISNLGVLAGKAGDRQKAAAFFRTVLELAPDDPMAKAWLEEF